MFHHMLFNQTGRTFPLLVQKKKNHVIITLDLKLHETGNKGWNYYKCSLNDQNKLQGQIKI